MVIQIMYFLIMIEKKTIYFLIESVIKVSLNYINKHSLYLFEYVLLTRIPQLNQH